MGGTSLSDAKRGRGLMWLTLAALLSAGLAVGTVLSTRAAVKPAAMSEAMFPGLAEASAGAASIKIESPTVFVTLNRGADGKWVVADRSNYPANPDGVRALLLSISQLQLIERRTADPARLGALDLTTGKDGTGHAVTIAAADGTVLAAVVAGKVQARALGNTPGTLFVRRAGEDQTWLARGGIAIPASVGATLDKTLFKLDPGAVQSVRIEPHGGAAYTLSKASADAPGFTLEGVPEGKEAQPAAILQTPASAIAGLAFDDVLKADAVEVKDATLAIFTTFEGLTVKVTLTAAGEDAAYALFEASAGEGASEAAKAQAAAIAARTGGWAYKLPAYVVTNLAPKLDTLVQDKPKPAPAPEKTPPAPEEGEVPPRAPQ